jgi:hypothetical protein
MTGVPEVLRPQRRGTAGVEGEHGVVGSGYEHRVAYRAQHRVAVEVERLRKDVPVHV